MRTDAMLMMGTMFPSVYYTQTAVPSLMAMMSNLSDLMKECRYPEEKRHEVLNAFDLPLGGDRFRELFDNPELDVEQGAGEYTKLYAAIVQARAELEGMLKKHNLEDRQRYEDAEARALGDDLWLPADFKARLIAYKAWLGSA